MSSRFVSGGTIKSTGEVTKDEPGQLRPEKVEAVKNEQWEAVQQELEAERKRREEHRIKTATGEEKSLYDILQENKAAKQAAFEEQSKVRNQFRALDDDEIDFLDDVREAKRKEDERVRRETEEGLKAFREQQVVGPAGGQTETQSPEEDLEQTWGVGRKRKRVKDKETKGLVKRKVSGGHGESKRAERIPAESTTSPAQKETVGEEKPIQPTKKIGLSLVDYGSDDSDGDD